jgi:hypothetical protein
MDAKIQSMSTEPLFVPGWEVTSIRIAEKFFSALTEILPLPVNLCFEGTSISSDVQSLLASNVVTPRLQHTSGHNLAEVERLSCARY